MGLLTELVAGLTAIIIDELRDWTVVLVGGAVFFGTAIAGNMLFGEVIGLALGIVCGVATAAILGDRLPNPLHENTQ